MARKDPRPEVNRRKFLAGVAVAGAATAVTPPVANAATPATSPSAEPPRRPSALPPNMHVAAAETGTPKELPRIGGVAGSDFMVDVIKTLDIKYCPSNCASSFRGIHESLINYGGNKMPEFLTCTHEESAVGMAHGYFKITGKPLMSLCHGTVGLQHATMAVYNAWCDRVPVIVMGGNDLDAAHRPPGVPTFHSAQDINAMVRDYTKWDDTPVVAAALRAVVRARLQDLDDAALRAGDDLARRRPAAGADQEQRREALHPALRGELAAAGRYRRGEGSGAASRQRRASGDRRRSRGAHRERHPAAGAACRAAAGAGGRPGRPDELPEDPLSQPSAHGGQQRRRRSSAWSSPTSGPS